MDELDVSPHNQPAKIHVTEINSKAKKGPGPIILPVLPLKPPATKTSTANAGEATGKSGDKKRRDSSAGLTLASSTTTTQPVVSNATSNREKPREQAEIPVGNVKEAKMPPAVHHKYAAKYGLNKQRQKEEAHKRREQEKHRKDKIEKIEKSKKPLKPSQVIVTIFFHLSFDSL